MVELAQLFAHIDPSQRPSRDDGLAEAMRIAEALLFAAAEPLAEKDIEYFRKKIDTKKELAVPEALIESALKESPVYHDLFYKQQKAQKAFDDFAGGAVDKKQIKRALGLR